MNAIKINDYKLYKLIGKGTFGEVYLTSNIDNSKVYATKRIEFNINSNKTSSKYLINEIEIMKELDHPNLIKLYNLLKTNNHYYLIMDYCNGGTLSSILNKYKLFFGKPFSQEIIQHFMKQIVDGLKYIHSKNIIHRDIKLDNILLNFDNIEDKNNLNLLSAKIKIIDFGLATKISPEGIAKTYAGTPLNMDPNILKKYNKAGGYEKLQGYNQKADIWSLGTICFEMLTGEVLFKGENIKDLVEQEDQGDYSIPINFELSKEIIDFLNSMIQYEGNMRLSAEELSKHDFLVKDIKDFNMVKLDQISNKIENGMLILNIKHNSTIIDYIKSEKKLEKPKEIEKEKNYINKTVRISNKKLITNKYIRFNPISSKNVPFVCPKDMDIGKRGFEPLASPNRNRRRNIFPEEREFQNFNLHELKNYFPQENEKQENWDQKPQNYLNQNMELLVNNKEMMLKYLNNLLNEYQNAKDYFNKNKLKEQEIVAINKCLEIKDIKDKIDSNSPYNSDNIPKPITPEFIYGYSKEERNQRFINILNKFYYDKRKLEQKINSERKYAITKNIIEEFKKKESQLKEINRTIKCLENNSKKKWAPAPKCIFESQNFQVEKISYENCEFKINFKIKIEDNIKDNINIKISFKINEAKILYKEVKLTMENNFTEEWTCTLNSNEWKNIDNNSENFILIMETDNIFENNSKSSIKIDIRKIKTGKKIDLKLSLLTMNNNKSIINFMAIPLIPKGKKYLAIERNKIFILKDIYPAFEGKIIT